MLIVALFTFLLLAGAEIYLFIVVGGFIGALPTVALVFLAALAGAAIIRTQAPRAIGRVQDTFRSGVALVAEMLDGMALFAAGALLILPGFLSDAIGILLLIPWVRRSAGFGLLALVLTVHAPDRPSGGVIDGEFEVKPGGPEAPSETPSRRIPPAPEAG